MNQEIQSLLSNNKLRRMQGWARALYPGDAQDRCAIVAEYIAQQDAEAAADLIKKGWPDVFAAAERDWPEAFAALKKPDSAAG